MAKAIHYKFANIDGSDTPFCKLPEDYYPSKYTSKKNKINPLKEKSTFPSGFCSSCKKALENQELIDKE